MAWFEVSSVFRNIQSSFLNSITNNNKVIEVKQDKYSDCAVICREEDLILYQNQSSSDIKYDIVLLRPHSDQAYSLYRSKELDDAQVQYITLKDKLPLLVSVTPWTCNSNSIQKLVDLLREKQSWSVGHIIVHLKWGNCVTHPIIQSFLNVADLENGMTPIQLAIQNRDIAVVRQLIAAHASLDVLDNQRNSVFHFAASSNKEIALALVEAKSEDEVKKCLNERNADGYTPLHIACQTDNPDCVKTFLQSGADCNITAAKSNFTSQQSASPGYVADFMKANQNKLHIQDMKFGGTPLHWSCSREVIETLVDRNCDVNALNFDGKTALHMMVMRNRLACVVALLSRHAEINITDEDGNTALHVAVAEKNIAIVQALIVFGADINHLNNSGFSPRHLAALENDDVGEKILYILHAVGSQRCDNGVLGCTDGCSRNGTFNGQPPPTPIGAQARAILRCFENYGNLQNLKETKGGRLLCLDGGGIRGLILVSVLLNLESAVNRPIIHCFDWIAGTSTGAILALGLAAGKTLKECQCLYFRMKDYAFSGTRPYSSEPLEEMLKKALGSTTVMSDIKDVKIMITAVLADRKPVDMHLFRNYENPSEIIDPNPSYGSFAPPTPPQEQYLWHAARASGAAPSYFKSCDRFIDGGLIANNPTLDALTEIHEYNLALKTVGRGAEAKPLTVAVSVGTGCVPVTTQSKRVEIFRPESPMDGLKFMTGVSALANLLVDQATQADGRVIDRCRSWCSMINVPFFRFSPQLSEDIAMDEKSDEKLVNMLWETLAYMTSNKKEVQKLAILLNYELDGSNPMECNNQ